MRIALVQSADDLTRYPYADTISFVESCCRGDPPERPVLAQLQPTAVEAVSEEGILRLFETLDPVTWRAVVFATNALNSELIWSVVEGAGERLLDYMGAGGGLVFFQGNYRTPSALATHFGFSAGHRACNDPQSTQPTSRGRDDVLLHHPASPVPSDLAETAEGRMQVAGGRPWGRLHWETIELTSSSTMIPVLESAAGELLLARSGSTTGMRLVVAKVLSDWQRQRPLLRNILSFAVAGAPTVLAFGPNGDNEAIAQTLGTGEHVVWMSEQEVSADSWLGRHVRLALTGPVADDPAEFSPRTSLEHALVARGGTLLAAHPSRDLHACRVSAVIGSRDSRLVTDDLLAQLAENPNWGEEGYPETSIYRLRNVLAALDYLRTTYGPDVVPELSPSKRERLRTRIGDWLTRPNEPVVTVLAAIESLLLLGGPIPADALHACVDDATGAGPEIRLLWRALSPDETPGVDDAARCVEQILGRTPGAAAVTAGQPIPRLAALGRLCEAVAVLGRRGLLTGTGGTDLGGVLVAAVGAPVSQVGWLSTETTATILRGIIAAAPAGPLPADYVRAVAAGAAALRHERQRAQTPRYAVGWYARITEALVAVENVLPTGLAIPLGPGQTGPDDVLPGLRSANNLLNDQLQDARATLEEERQASKVARQAHEIALPLGWSVLLLVLLALFSLPFVLPFVVTGVPVDRKITVASILGPLWYGVLVAAIRRYPLIPPWLRGLTRPRGQVPGDRPGARAT